GPRYRKKTAASMSTASLAPPSRRRATSTELDRHVLRAIAFAWAARFDRDGLFAWAAAAHLLAETVDADPIAKVTAIMKHVVRIWCHSGGGETGRLERNLVAERSG